MTSIPSILHRNLLTYFSCLHKTLDHSQVTEVLKKIIVIRDGCKVKNAQSFVWKDKGWTSVKHNGNRTKKTSFRSVIVRVINKIGRPRLTVLDETMLFVIVIPDGCKAKDILSNHGKMHKALCGRTKDELQLNIMVIGPSGLHFDLWSYEWLTLGRDMIASTVRRQQTDRLQLNRMISEE